MKKIISVLLTCVLLVGCMFTLASCGGPNADPDKALEALKSNEYTAAEDKYVIPGILTLAGVKDLDTVISGTKVDKENDDKVEHVTVIYFEDADAATDAWDKVKEYAEDDKDEEDTDWVINKSGAMIYWGTKAGVAAAG